MSVMIEQSLGKILTEISQKLENVQKDVTDIKIKLTQGESISKAIDNWPIL